MTIEALAESIGFEVEEYRQFLDILVSSTEKDIAALQHALDSANADAAREAAHSIKGAAANLALTELSETARSIEDLARKNLLQEIPTHVRTLEQNLRSISQL